MPLPDAMIAALQREAAKNAEAENAFAAALMQNVHPGDAQLYLSLMLSERRKRMAAEHKLEELFEAIEPILDFKNHADSDDSEAAFDDMFSPSVGEMRRILRVIQQPIKTTTEGEE